MKIQVLGAGCPTCKKFFELTLQAVNELGLKYQVEYITDLQQIIALGVMSSPVLAIDGKPVVAGQLPSLEKLKQLLSIGHAASGAEPSGGIGADNC